MTFFKRLNEKHGIYTYSVKHYEMNYLKFGGHYNLYFTAPDDKGAQSKALSILRNFGGQKIVSIKKLSSVNLADSLTWNR